MADLASNLRTFTAILVDLDYGSNSTWLLMLEQTKESAKIRTSIEKLDLLIICCWEGKNRFYVI